MSGVKPLRKIQYGWELTAGSEVAATDIWRGMGVMDDQSDHVVPEEDVGYLIEVQRMYTPKYLAAITFDETEATFEQLPVPFACSVENINTGSQDGSGGYVYQYDIPTTTANSFKMLTMEAGNNQQEEQFLYAFCHHWNLKGAAGEALKITSDWFGRQVAPGTFTGGISLQTVEEILFGKGKLWIDAAGSMGGNQATGTFLGFELDYTSGLVPRFTGDGQLYFTRAAATRPVVTFNLTLEHDATAVAEVAAWKAHTARDIQMTFEGSAISGGSTYSYKTLLIKLALLWEKWDPLEDDDGNDTRTGSGRVGYNSTSGLAGQIIVVNNLSALR